MQVEEPKESMTQRSAFDLPSPNPDFNVDEKIQEQIRQYAIKVFKAVDGHGLSRVDFFLDKKTNKVYLNEINTMPGFTKISMYPQLMEDFGISYSELLDRLIVLAMQR